MKKETRNLLIIVGIAFFLLIVAVVLYAISKKKKHEDAAVVLQDIKAQAPVVASGGVVVPSSGPKSSIQNLDLVLKKGMSSPEVATLQAMLNLSKKYNLTVDGAFGSKTEAALLAVTDKKQITLNQMAPIVAGLKFSGSEGSLFSWG